MHKHKSGILAILTVLALGALDLAPGRYRLVAGLYAPEGSRLLTADGRDAVHITELRVAEP